MPKQARKFLPGDRVQIASDPPGASGLAQRYAGQSFTIYSGNMTRYSRKLDHPCDREDFGLYIYKLSGCPFVFAEDNLKAA